MHPTAASPIRHRPSPTALFTHLLLLAGAFALVMGRTPGAFRMERLAEALPGVYGHVSNFSLSFLLYAGIGFMWLMTGVAPRAFAWAALALIAANLVYELLLPVLNTRDPIDAAYGLVGSLLAWLWIGLVRRFGLRAVPVST